MGKWAEHFFMMAFETTLTNQLAILLTDVRQILPDKHRQQRITELVRFELLGVILELLQQNRHKVKCDARNRISFQVVSHIAVILNGVQIGPWQHIFVAYQIAIIRLMHMPIKIEVQLGSYSTHFKALN